MNTTKQTFPVTGMHCAACVLTVEKALKSAEGVNNASVNLATSSALVEYDDTIAKPENIKKAVQGAGYDLLVQADENTPQKTEARNRKHYKNLLLRTVLAMACSIPLVLISMVHLHIRYQHYVEWALATPVLLFCGRQFFRGAWMQLKHFSANMDTLVALSTGIAYIFSIVNTVYPQFWTRQGLEANVYFEASAAIIAFILLGKLLEERAKANTGAALKKLMALQPDSVSRINKEGEEEDVPLYNVLVNDILLVRPGEQVPLDGAVIEGQSYIDEKMLTGEPVAVEKKEGDKVFAGTINLNGSFTFRAEKVGSDTMLAHIIKKVQEAQGSKAPVQKLADTVASVFVPIVLLIALVTLGAWSIWGGANGFTHGLLAMVTVLVIACPCALGLATPTAIIAGIGKGAENGILIKDAASLETALKINAIVLDKTGTITEGNPAVTDIVWKDGVDSAMLSSVIYSMEHLSTHPLAMAITNFFEELGTDKIAVQSFDNIPGSGVTALYARKIYFVGSVKLLKSMNISIPESLTKKTAIWLEHANSVIWLADEFSALAAIAVADIIKPGSGKAVQLLKSMGIDVYMLTGDSLQTAYVVAEEAGITQFKAEVSPTEKAEFVKELQGEGKIVAMVGDGINDSPALAQADIGIAMGKGADIAMDSATVTLISSDLNYIPRAIRLSAKTVRIIRQNLFWAFVYNVIGIPLAAGVLYPVNGFLLNPMLAGAAMALSSVSVVTNSLRLKWGELE